MNSICISPGCISNFFSRFITIINQYFNDSIVCYPLKTNSMKIFILTVNLFLFLLSGISKGYCQTNHFIPAGNNADVMNIYILEAKLNGLNLVAGDEIGIFDGNLCVGAYVLTGDLGTLNDELYAAAKAFKEDAGGDGFVSGHPIQFGIGLSGSKEETEN